MTESIHYSSTVPVAGETEVLVVGGGPAGIAAAIASARQGARTLLIEQYGFLGGMATAALVGPFMTSYDIEGQEPIIEGIFREVVDRMVDLGQAVDPAGVKGFTAYGGYHRYGHEHVTPFDPEALKVVAQEMALEAGVTLRFHTFFLDSLTKEATIAGVLCASKAGLEAFRAEVVIDTTGDGDVAARAGAPYEVGRPADGRLQPVSLFFRVGNVDDAAVQAYIDAHPDDPGFVRLMQQAKEREGFTHTKGHLTLFRTPRPGEWWCNVSRVHGVDGTDPAQLTRAEIEGREQVLYLIDFFQGYVPGFERCYLLDTGAQVGVRETRRILGAYVLTAEDVFAARRFPDAIARVSFPIDIHDVSGGGGFFEGPRGGPYYTIPYRCLVPLQVENLLVAGRPISATHEAHGSLRVMPPCFATGQAAGTAAALALETGVLPRGIDVTLLQRSLEQQGALI
ncbi:MAG: FAD-dependent oxidoreductase [Anaerolineae bacterium]